MSGPDYVWVVTEYYGQGPVETSYHKSYTGAWEAFKQGPRPRLRGLLYRPVFPEEDLVIQN